MEGNKGGARYTNVGFGEDQGWGKTVQQTTMTDMYLIFLLKPIDEYAKLI